MFIPLMFNCEAESDTVNVKFCELPADDAPEGGDTESAVGEPPVAVQVPTCTQPEFTPNSPAYRYMALLPEKAAVNVTSRIRTTVVVPYTTCEFTASST